MDQFDFINRANADYIERLHQQYQADPRSVEPHWRAFFAGFEAGSGRIAPSVTKSEVSSSAAASPAGASSDSTSLNMEIADLVHSYRELGHFVAKLDPLGHKIGRAHV